MELGVFAGCFFWEWTAGKSNDGCDGWVPKALAEDFGSDEAGTAGYDELHVYYRSQVSEGDDLWKMLKWSLCNVRESGNGIMQVEDERMQSEFR